MVRRKCLYMASSHRVNIHVLAQVAAVCSRQRLLRDKGVT